MGSVAKSNRFQTLLWSTQGIVNIYKCNLTVYVGIRDDLGAQRSPIDGSTRRREESFTPRKLVSRPKKAHTDATT